MSSYNKNVNIWIFSQTFEIFSLVTTCYLYFHCFSLYFRISKNKTKASTRIISGHTQLSLAICMEMENKVEELLKNGSNVNGMIPSLKHKSMPYLIYACIKKNLDIVKILIKHGADVNVTYEYGNSNLTALQWLIKPSNDLNQNKIFLELLKHGADANKVVDPFKLTSLHIAAREGNSEAIKHILNYHDNINPIDLIGLTPLHYAIKNEHNSCVTLLLEAGCEVNPTNKNIFSSSPLQFATLNRNAEIVSQLIENGAKVNVQDRSGKTPLHNAVQSCSELDRIECVKIVSKLLKEPLDLNLRNKDGKTAYELALEKKCHDIFRMFTHR